MGAHVDRPPICPAALAIRSATEAGRGVICRVMQSSATTDPGLRTSPRALEVLRASAGGVYLNLKTDPRSVLGFCYGDAVPVIAADDRTRASYTCCPVWEKEKARIEAGRAALVVDAEPESVSMGLSSQDADDPWEAAAHGLEELTS
jgi:hypothetical protein